MIAERLFVTAPKMLGETDVINQLPIAVVGFEKYDDEGNQTGYLTLAEFCANSPDNRQPTFVGDTHFTFGFEFTRKGSNEFVNYVESLGVQVIEEDGDMTITGANVLYLMRWSSHLELTKVNELWVKDDVA